MYWCTRQHMSIESVNIPQKCVIFNPFIFLCPKRNFFDFFTLSEWIFRVRAVTCPGCNLFGYGRICKLMCHECSPYSGDVSYTWHRSVASRSRSHFGGIHHVLWYFLFSDNLNASTVKVIPLVIRADSIACVGQASWFNVTWQPSTEVNHGHVTYELSIQADGVPDMVQVGFFE